MGKGSYVLIKEAFHLHEATLESLYDQGGVCSDHLTCKSHVDNEDRFGNFSTISRVDFSVH